MSRSILHLIRTLDPERGGPVTFLKQLSAVHAAMGVRVAILTLDRNEPAWVADLPVSAARMRSQPGQVRLQSGSGKQIDRACGHVRHDGGPRALAIPRVLRDAGFGKNR